MTGGGDIDKEIQLHYEGKSWDMRNWVQGRIVPKGMGGNSGDL